MKITGTFYFDPEDKIYIDHFPGNPVVPGSVIVSAFLSAAQKHCNIASGLITVQDFRFRIFVSPGTYDYSLSDKDKFVECKLFDNGKRVVSGKIFI